MTESRTTTAIVADLLRSAPAWARVGLTAPTSRVRKDAIAILADHIASGLATVRDDDRDQLSLPL